MNGLVKDSSISSANALEILQSCAKSSKSTSILLYLLSSKLCFFGILYKPEPLISNYTQLRIWDEITYTFSNFNRTTIEVLEWMSNFIPHFTGHMITYPCWDLSVSMLVE